MKKYNSYKNSGFDFVPEIPSNWKGIKLKYCLNLQSGKGITNEKFKDNAEYSVYGGNGILGKTDDFSHEGEHLVIGRVGALCGNVRLVKGKKWISDNALVATTYEVPKYIEYSLKVLDLNRLANQNAQPLITGTMVKGQYIGLPSSEEQTQIANYLDYKTSEIDKLIAQKEALIILLEEERTATINQAVTKGLDPNVPMKDSGIEWLGEIPEHWILSKIGYISSVIRGASPRPAGDPLLFNGDFMPWITVKEVTNAKGKFIVNTETYLTELGAKQTRILEPETLILSNSGATLGVPRITLIKGAINDGSVAFLNLKIEREFLYYFFITHTSIYREEVSGYGQPNLNTEIVKSTKIAIPPRDEVSEIISFVEKEIKRFDKVVNKYIREIKLLKEYKQSLITNVVTGKVDVRDEVIA